MIILHRYNMRQGIGRCSTADGRGMSLDGLSHLGASIPNRVGCPEREQGAADHAGQAYHNPVISTIRCSCGCCQVCTCIQKASQWLAIPTLYA